MRAGVGIGQAYCIKSFLAVFESSALGAQAKGRSQERIHSTHRLGLRSACWESSSAFVVYLVVGNETAFRNARAGPQLKFPQYHRGKKRIGLNPARPRKKEKEKELNNKRCMLQKYFQLRQHLGIHDILGTCNFKKMAFRFLPLAPTSISPLIFVFTSRTSSSFSE
jgi:hypothetical protein